MKIICFYTSHADDDKRKLKKALIKTTLITLGIVVSYGALPVLAGVNTDGIDTIGYSVWKVLKRIAMFALAGFTVRDILKELNDSSLKDIGTIVVKYAAAWAIIVFILKIFTWIDKLAN